MRGLDEGQESGCSYVTLVGGCTVPRVSEPVIPVDTVATPEEGKKSVIGQQ
jgi:hypothetical protein